MIFGCISIQAIANYDINYIYGLIKCRYPVNLLYKGHPAAKGHFGGGVSVNENTSYTILRK